MRRRRKLIFSVIGLMALVLFLVIPFPLSSYIARNPMLDDQMLGGAPSVIYRWVYNWWITGLSEENPYKVRFNKHMKIVCSENPGFCSDATTK